MNDEKPQYRHDCDKRVFMGRHSFKAPLSTGKTFDVSVDLWICPENGPGTTCISRYGSNGPEYSSYPLNILARGYKHMKERPDSYAQGIVECFDRGLKHDQFKAQFEAAAKKVADQEAHDRKVYEDFRSATRRG